MCVVYNAVCVKIGTPDEQKTLRSYFYIPWHNPVGNDRGRHITNDLGSATVRPHRDTARSPQSQLNNLPKISFFAASCGYAGYSNNILIEYRVLEVALLSKTKYPNLFRLIAVAAILFAVIALTLMWETGAAISIAFLLGGFVALGLARPAHVQTHSTTQTQPQSQNDSRQASRALPQIGPQHLSRDDTSSRAIAAAAPFSIELDLLPDSIVISDKDGNTAMMNRSACKLLDIQKEPCNICDPRSGYACQGLNLTITFKAWHTGLIDKLSADQIVDAVMSAPDMSFTDVLHFENGDTIERITRPIGPAGDRLWILRDVSHHSKAADDKAMHNTLLEADAERNAELAEQLYYAKAELEQKQSELIKLANTDPLTGLNNRRRFLDLGERCVEDAIEQKSAIWLLMLDIDFFKKINDRYGHASGDEVIRDISRILSASAGSTAHCGRLGGEEFAIILPGADKTQACSVAEFIRQTVEKTASHVGGTAINYTTSIGVADWVAGEESIEAALDRADRALYLAKTLGRNRVVSADDLLEDRVSYSAE